MAQAEKLWTGPGIPENAAKLPGLDSAVLPAPTPLCKVNLTSTACREVILSSDKV